MYPETKTGDPVSGPSRQEIQRQLSLLLANEIFQGSPRMARFLQFIVEETLAGKAGQLKEVVIGTRVFDRSPDYDPRLDPIVRVEARRLRRKICDYYDAAGKQDPVMIDLPKGRYSPDFHFRVTKQDEHSSRAALDENTIAVLPFLNLDPDMEAGYFSDGLSEELIHALTLIQGLSVVAWHSASQLRHQQEDVAMIRDRLGAKFVLRGSVRQTGQRLRITVQLVQTADSHYIWSDAFDRQIEDVFAIQKEIAVSIASTLNLRLRTTASSGVAPAGVGNVEAYQLYLKGRFHARERTTEGLKRSLIFFEQAIALDSTSVFAYSGLADTYALLAEYGFADGCESMLRAKDAALRALALNPKCAEAHASLGSILALYDRDWAGAGAAFQRSFQLNPGYADAHFWYGVDYLAVLHRLEEAREQVDIALKHDPLSPIMLLGRGLLSIYSREYDRALREYTAVAEMDPSFFRAYASLGRANIQLGHYGAAIDVLKKARSIAGSVPSILGALGQAYGLSGNTVAARQILAELMDILNNRPVPSAAIAIGHLALGEKDEALTWLERGVARHQPAMVSLAVHPVYDELRAEPRFLNLLRIMDLSAASYRKITPAH